MPHVPPAWALSCHPPTHPITHPATQPHSHQPAAPPPASPALPPASARAPAAPAGGGQGQRLLTARSAQPPDRGAGSRGSSRRCAVARHLSLRGAQEVSAPAGHHRLALDCRSMSAATSSASACASARLRAAASARSLHARSKLRAWLVCGAAPHDLVEDSVEDPVEGGCCWAWAGVGDTAAHLVRAGLQHAPQRLQLRLRERQLLLRR
jgi:hypothetical protein